MRKRPLLLALCVFWLGIAFRNTWNLWLILAFGLICVYDLKPLKKRTGRGIMLLLIFLFGILHMHQNLAFREGYLSKLRDGDEVTIWGEIYKQEKLDETTDRIYLMDCYVSIHYSSVNDATTYIPCNNIMVYASSVDYQAGNILKIKGQFHNFKEAANEGNFDGHGFYHSQKIDFYVDAKEIESKGSNLSSLQKWILNLKTGIDKVYQNSLPKKWAGIMKGIVLGDRTELDENLKQLFTISGIVHILTVSGLHVSVLGKGFYRFLRNRRLGFLLSGIGAGILLIGYGNLTGNGVSTQRAIGMMFLFMLAQWIGRSYDMLNSLGGVCLWLLWENPFLIGYTGLWFSVMALIGVGWIGNYLSERSQKGKAFWMSVGVTLATLPIVAFCYYEVPLYSPLLNCIVIPLLTPVFICGVIGGLTGLFLPGVGRVILYPCQLILSFYEWLCEGIGKLPFATIITGQPPVWLIVAYYLVLGMGILWVKKKNHEIESLESKKEEWIKQMKWYTVKKWIFVVTCFALLFLYREKREFEINFLDVGQGDGIHIAIKDTHFFIDGGTVDVTGLGEYRILPYLKSNGIEKIHYWFVTHADTDHISGLLEVMESGYSIENLVLSEGMPKDENYKKVISTAKKQDIPVCYMKAGDVIRCETGEFRCLYPGKEEQEDRNEASLVLELVYEEKRALFTGDISSETESLLIKEGRLSDVWLYKAAHHGSKYSNSSELLEVITPEISVVSCSKTNVYGHPSLETIERIRDSGADIYYTMDVGQVTIKIYNEEVSIHAFKNKEICE